RNGVPEAAEVGGDQATAAGGCTRCGCSCPPAAGRYNQTTYPLRGAVAQLGERRVRNAEVRGSIPLGPTRIDLSGNWKVFLLLHLGNPAPGRNRIQQAFPYPIRPWPVSATRSLWPVCPRTNLSSGRNSGPKSPTCRRKPVRRSDRAPRAVSRLMRFLLLLTVL